jgi:hypothetical protein
MTDDQFNNLKAGDRIVGLSGAKGVVHSVSNCVVDILWDTWAKVSPCTKQTVLDYISVAGASASEWTNQKPTADGHYWAHLPFGNFTTIVEVSGGGRTCASVGSEQKVPTDEMCSQWLWMGPLQTPSPPTKKVRTDEMDK